MVHIRPFLHEEENKMLKQHRKLCKTVHAKKKEPREPLQTMRCYSVKMFTWEKFVCNLSLAFYDFGSFIFRFGWTERNGKDEGKTQIAISFLVYTRLCVLLQGNQHKKEYRIF